MTESGVIYPDVVEDWSYVFVADHLKSLYDDRGRSLPTPNKARQPVSVPAVRAQAAEFGVAFSLIIGYVVAHEAGHCLLGPGHSLRPSKRRGLSDAAISERLFCGENERGSTPIEFRRW